MGRVGSALLVFLVNLSIEQSTPQKHKHKIIGYTALFCMNTWKSVLERSRVSRGDAVGEQRAAPGQKPHPALSSLWAGRPVWFVFQLSGPNWVRGLWGIALAGLHTLPCALSPCPCRGGRCCTVPMAQPCRAGPASRSAAGRLLVEMDALTH